MSLFKSLLKSTNVGKFGTSILGNNRINSLYLLNRRNETVQDEMVGQETIDLAWITSHGNKIETKAIIGDSLLDSAHKNGIDLEGACESSLACSTCHCILESKVYKNLNEPSDEEWDMLDLAFGLTDTSRLGCQVMVTKQFDGCIIELPKGTNNEQNKN